MNAKRPNRSDKAKHPEAVAGSLAHADVGSALAITIANRQRTQRINSRRLKRIVAALFTELNLSSAELGIHLVGAQEMARVNWQYLQHEGSTDVITFDHSEADDTLDLYGELFVCVDDAVQQSHLFHTSWQSEVVRYVVHGVLHLLGYDDLKPHLRRQMKQEENRLLRRLEKGFSLAELSLAGKITA